MLKSALLKATLFATATLLIVTGFALLPVPDAEAAGGLSVRLVCEPGFSGAFCEVQNAPSGSTIQWSATGQVSVVPLFANAPLADANCWGTNGGNVTATVTSSSGASGTASRWVGCGYGGTF